MSTEGWSRFYIAALMVCAGHTLGEKYREYFSGNRTGFPCLKEGRRNGNEN